MYTLLSCPLYFICVFRNEDQNVISPQLMRGMDHFCPFFWRSAYVEHCLKIRLVHSIPFHFPKQPVNG